LTQLAHVPSTEEDRLQTCYLGLFQASLLHLQYLSAVLSKATQEAEEVQEKEGEEDEEDIEARVHEETTDVETAISNLNQLLALPDFLTVIASLLNHRDHNVQRRALTLLKAKLESLSALPPTNLILQFVALTKDLAAILVAPLPIGAGRHTALITQQTGSFL